MYILKIQIFWIAKIHAPTNKEREWKRRRGGNG
mgnify:CR=1 FL=1